MDDIFLPAAYTNMSFLSSIKKKLTLGVFFIIQLWHLLDKYKALVDVEPYRWHLEASVPTLQDLYIIVLSAEQMWKETCSVTLLIFMFPVIGCLVI